MSIGLKVTQVLRDDFMSHKSVKDMDRMKKEKKTSKAYLIPIIIVVCIFFIAILLY